MSKRAITLEAAQQIWQEAGINLRRNEELGVYEAIHDGQVLQNRLLIGICQELAKRLAS